MDHCELEGDRISQQHSDCYQEIIHKLEETIAVLQDKVKELSKVCDEARAENVELKRRNDMMRTELIRCQSLSDS